jgi:hypothetical protein
MIVVAMVFSIFGIWVLGLSVTLPHRTGGTVKSILGRGEHWWERIGAVYASDICHFRDTDSLFRRCVEATLLQL